MRQTLEARLYEQQLKDTLSKWIKGMKNCMHVSGWRVAHVIEVSERRVPILRKRK